MKGLCDEGSISDGSGRIPHLREEHAAVSGRFRLDFRKEFFPQRVTGH